MATICPRDRSRSCATHACRPNPLRRRRSDRDRQARGPAGRCAARGRRLASQRAIDELKLGFKRPPMRDASARQRHRGLPAVRAHAHARAPLSSRRSRRGAVEKNYLAVVGRRLIAEEKGVIDCRSPRCRAPRPAGGWSRTHGQAGAQRAGGGLPVRDGRRLVEFRPLTGRTHQIRVHAARGVGAAIVGDPVYGVPAAARCCSTPGGWSCRASRKAAIDVTAPVPDCFGVAGLPMRPEDVHIPEDALSEKLPRRDRARAGRTSTRSRPRASCASTCSGSACTRTPMSG